MQIGGFQKFSLIDYPDKMAAVVFTLGCNYRCPYCHNPELVIPSLRTPEINEEEVLSFLFERKEKLQGVVVTGGEPTLQDDLMDFLRKVKQMGFCVKLDTNGSRPQIVREIIDQGLADLVCMDIKAPLEKYALLTGIDVNTENIQESIRIILDSGVKHIFRTTIVKSFFQEEDFAKIHNLIQGARKYNLQAFVHQSEILDKTLLDQAHYTDEEFSRLAEAWQIDHPAVLKGKE